MTEIIFLIDRSGSMHICEEDTIGGYNSFLETQKHDDSQALITTVLFDNHYEIIHDHVELQAIEPLTRKEYFARGTTALLDAIGVTISEAAERQTESKSDAKTLMIIITDGLDNASRIYHIKDIYDMIHEQQEHHGWEFIFLGADIDSVRTAQSIGISRERAGNFRKDRSSIGGKFAGISRTVSHFRSSGSIDSSWMSE